MNSRSTSKSAFTLIEVTLALGVVSFCLLAVFGLLPIGLNTNQNATEQTAAAGVATAISADLRSTPVVSGSTARFALQIPAVGGSSVQTLFFSADGTATARNADATAFPVGTTARYRATITMAAIDTSTSTTAPRPYPFQKLFKVGVLITWPALADPISSNSPKNYSGSFETITSLNCN